MKKYFQNEKGGMLVYTLLVFLIFTILGVSLMAYTYSDVKLSQVDHKQQGAFYIAEAGANQAFHSIKEEIYLKHEAAPNKEIFFSTLQAYLDTNWSSETIDDFEEQFGANPRAQVKIEQTGADPYTFQIQSTGKIDGQERIVTKSFTVNYRKGGSSFLDLPDGVAGIFRNSAKFEGSASIDKDMFLLTDKPSSIEFQGDGKVKGTVFVPENAVDHILDPGSGHWIHTDISPLPRGYDQQWFDEQLTSIIHSFPESFPSYSYPDNREVTKDGNKHMVINNGNLNINDYRVSNFTWQVTNNTALRKINIDNDYKLNINTQGRDIDLVVDELVMPQGHFNIVGGGKINLYVKNKIELGGGSKINDSGSTEQLSIYYAGTEKINLAGGQNLNANIFAKSADVELTAGGNFKGYIISGGGSVVLDGGNFSEALIIAPLAQVEVKAGATVNGVVIGKTLYANGGININYKKFDTSLLPFEPIEGDGGGDIIESEPTIEIE